MRPERSNHDHNVAVRRQYAKEDNTQLNHFRTE
uniref:Uncharacterized protein n=1 Tax=Anopheles dirus TaxID=7168 RepID=A0A182NWS9_9DIPT